MSTTAAVYPEVAAELEQLEAADRKRARRLRIQEQVAELVLHPEARLEKLPAVRGLVFTSYRMREGVRWMVTVQLDPDESPFTARLAGRPDMEALRGQIIDKLTQLLERELA